MSSNSNILSTKAELTGGTSDEDNATLMHEDENYRELLETGKNSDFIILINDGETPLQPIKVHKFVLEKSSPIFKAMLLHNMLESRTGAVEIKEITYDLMMHTLRHVYGNKLTDNHDLEDIYDLLLVADRYQIESLKIECSEYIVDKGFITTENLPSILHNISLFAKNSEKFMMGYTEFLAENAYNYFKNDSFLELSRQALSELLIVEKFLLLSELDIINFLARWALHKVGGVNFRVMQMRECLGNDIISKIRFLCIPRNYFIADFAIAVLLTSEERELVILALESDNIPDNFPSYFSQSRTIRCYINSNFTKPNHLEIKVAPYHLLVNLGEESFNRKEYFNNNSNFRKYVFEIDRNSYQLDGFKLSYCQNRKLADGNMRNIHVKITTATEQFKSIWIKEANLSQTHYSSYLLDNPIVLKANQQYSISCHFTGICYDSYSPLFSQVIHYSDSGNEFTITRCRMETIGVIQGLILKKNQLGV